MTGAPQAASRVVRLPLEGVELIDAPGSVGRDEQDACVAALHEQRVHLLAVDADVGERAPEVVGAALVVAQTHGLPEHHFGIERFPVLREAVARHLRRVDEQVADPDAAFQLDGVAVDDARDLRFRLAARRAGARGGERERGDRYCFRHCPGPTSTNRAKSAHPGATSPGPGVILGDRAIWAGVVRPLQRGTLTVLGSETPCEKCPVPARSAPKPLTSARASVPVSPPHASTRQRSVDPGTSFAWSVSRRGKRVDFEVVATSRLPETNPSLSTRSKWSTEIEPSGAVQASGAAADGVPPESGFVIRGGAGMSISKVVVDGERLRATTVVAELGGQIVRIRNDRGTSDVNPTIEASAGAQPGA